MLGIGQEGGLTTALTIQSLWKQALRGYARKGRGRMTGGQYLSRDNSAFKFSISGVANDCTVAVVYGLTAKTSL